MNPPTGALISRMRSLGSTAVMRPLPEENRDHGRNIAPMIKARPITGKRRLTSNRRGGVR